MNGRGSRGLLVRGVVQVAALAQDAASLVPTVIADVGRHREFRAAFLLICRADCVAEAAEATAPAAVRTRFGSKDCCQPIGFSDWTGMRS